MMMQQRTGNGITQKGRPSALLYGLFKTVIS
jgi:hypothetical protein